MNDDQKITIVEIAKEAGVSISTVSRVINGSAVVSEKTRERVSEVIKRHHFTPSAVARTLVSRQSMTIGIIMPDISNPYFAAMFAEFEKEAMKAGYAVLLCNTGFSSDTAQTTTAQEIAYFQMMLEKKVDGVLIVGGQVDLVQVSPDYRQALKQLANMVPVVVLGSEIEGIPCQFIQRERGQGVFAAINYLASLGHERIAFVGGERGVGITEMRLETYQTALNTMHLFQDPALIATTDYYAPDGYLAVQQLMERNVPFTAMLCMNDNVAFGAYRALNELGLRIPQDVSIISCDQFYTAPYYIPSLTSVDQHNELFGRYIVHALLGAMNGVHENVSLLFQPELIIRESCASPKEKHFSDAKP